MFRLETKLIRLCIHMGVSRKLATSVNQGDKILTMMDVLKCTQITLLKLNFRKYPAIHTHYS